MARRKKRGEMSRYFRGIFEQHPERLNQTSNAETMADFRRDHGLGAEDKIPDNFLGAMANIKSTLRKQGRKGRGRVAKAQIARSGSKLEALEVLIDEAMLLARNIDRDGLNDVWETLRKARNAVVLKGS